MDLNEFINRVQAFKAEVVQTGPKINAAISLSALSLVKDRIINDGKSSSGSSLGKYSTNPLPVYFFLGKSLGSGAESKVKAANKRNKGKGVSYEEFRELNNLQTNHVDLKFSGAMWSDMAVLETKASGSISVSVVGSKDAQSYVVGRTTTGQVAEFMGDKYGDFLQPSLEEQNILNNALDEELQKLIDEYFR